MAISATVVNATSFKAASDVTFVDDVSFTLDASYPTGGYAGLQAALNAALQSSPYAYPYNAQGNRSIVDIITSIDAGSGYLVAWDAAAGKVKLFTSNGASPAAPLEVPNGTNLSAITLRLRVLSA